MKTNHQNEVLVVGAGPVGMLTALVLGENGIQTRLIDQESRTATHSYACALHPRSIRLLDQAGVAGDAIELGWIIDSIGFYEGNIRRRQLSLSGLDLDFPFVLVLPQCWLEDFFEGRVRQLPNVQIDWNHRFEDLRMENDRVAVRISKLGLTGKGYSIPELDMSIQREWEIHADYVVGADGQNSLVRQRLNIDSEIVGGPDLFSIFEFETDTHNDHEMKVIFAPGTVSVMWPLSANRCRWSFQISPAGAQTDFPQKDRVPFVVAESPSPNDSRHRLLQLLCERAPWFERSIKAVPWTADIQFGHRLVREFGRGRCWLVGDAAHQTGPVGMQSVNLGFNEAVDLANILKRILRNGASTDLLETYDWRHRVEWQKLLGLTGGPKFTTETPAWIIENRARILASLPASGKELTTLVGQLGMEFAAT